MLIIGDVHGKVDAYKKIVESYPEGTIQVGDFGFSKEHIWHIKNIDSKHKINFGNHDDTTFLLFKHSLGACAVNTQLNLMTMRGAKSIDKMHRVKGIDWFEDEELTYEELADVVLIYDRHKPTIMVTHDCPSSVRQEMFNIPNSPPNKSKTTAALQAMLELHQPDLWIFGHHHKHKDEIINGTRFICLEELETFEI